MFETPLLSQQPHKDLSAILTTGSGYLYPLHVDLHRSTPKGPINIPLTKRNRVHHRNAFHPSMINNDLPDDEEEDGTDDSDEGSDDDQDNKTCSDDAGSENNDTNKPGAEHKDGQDKEFTALDTLPAIMAALPQPSKGLISITGPATLPRLTEPPPEYMATPTLVRSQSEPVPIDPTSVKTSSEVHQEPTQQEKLELKVQPVGETIPVKKKSKALATGDYTIENVKQGNDAVLLDANQDSGVVGDIEVEHEGRAWTITQFKQTNKYTIKNVHFGGYASVMLHHTDQDGIVRKRDIIQWRIIPVEGSDAFIIAKKNDDLYWGLPDDEPKTPVGLRSGASDSSNHWRFNKHDPKTETQ